MRNVKMNNILSQVFKLLPAQRRARLSVSYLLAVQETYLRQVPDRTTAILIVLSMRT